MLFRRLIPITVVPLILVAWFMLVNTQTRPALKAAPAAPAAASSTGCISYWYVSYSGTQSYQFINTDLDGLPLSDLRFSRTYNDPTDYSRGYLDFNHDRKSDVFSVSPIGGGNYRWRYSSGGTSAWIDLGYDSTPIDQLRFGDFNGDGYTDVFAATPIGGGNYQWKYSPGGANSYINLAYDNTPLDQLRFGDFNADLRTDVFALKYLGAGNLGWRVSYSGTTSYVQINSAATPLSEMQFGDINGDGYTDLFTTTPDPTPGLYNWKYSSAGSGAYQSMFITALSVHDVGLVGDFDDDNRSDFFFTTPISGTLRRWRYYYYKTSPFSVGSNPLAIDSTPPDQLRFADFNNDGVTDVFKLVRQCQVYLPLVRR